MATIRDLENERWEEWDNGDFGRDEAYVEACTSVDEKAIDDALELQSINIRMPKDLLEDLKRIALINNIGYQPLMKQVLQRFVTSEMKIILRDLAERKTARDAMDKEIEQQQMQQQLKVG